MVMILSVLLELRRRGDAPMERWPMANGACGAPLQVPARSDPIPI
jgi:hypothetical protein